MDHLFIYGLLQKEFSNPFSRMVGINVDYLGPCYVFGSLYEIDGYPGLIISENGIGKVHGTLCLIKELSLLKTLDTFEGVGTQYPEPNEYRREKITVFLGDQKIEAWTFLYNWAVQDENLIESGNYISFCTRKNLS